jgi:hypothetical protein
MEDLKKIIIQTLIEYQFGDILKNGDYINGVKKMYFNDVAETIVKNLSLSGVSHRRELLFAYEKMRTNHIIGATDEWRYANVDLFLSK